MILYRYRQPGWRTASFGVGTDDGLVNLASHDGFRPVQSWSELLALPNLVQRVTDAVNNGVPQPVEVPWDQLAAGPATHLPHLVAPVDRQEVWGAGVTYQVSRLERMRESEAAADVYARVYDAPRPELFFKATAERVIGPGGEIRVRADSTWTVPEPELALVCSPTLGLLGFSLGNDVSARDIEGENPLYLPQAKIYRGACSLGPGMVLNDGEFDPLAQTIGCRIIRDGQTLYEDTAPVSRLKRTFAELLEHLGREETFPHGVVLLTGTCLVPPEDLCLAVGDVVELSLTGLGVLRNVVGP